MSRPKLTYANVVSTIALFAVLAGGTAWALKNNSVSSRHIKDGSVKFRDLEGVQSWNKGVPVTGIDTTAAAAREAAQDVILFKRGSLTVFGRCYMNSSGSGVVFATVFARTTQDGAIMTGGASGYNNPHDGDPTYLDTDTAIAFSGLASVAAVVESTDVTEPAADTPFTLVAANRTVHLNGVVSVAAKHGTPAGGDGPYGAGDRCLFGGYVIG